MYTVVDEWISQTSVQSTSISLNRLRRRVKRFLDFKAQLAMSKFSE